MSRASSQVLRQISPEGREYRRSLSRQHCYVSMVIDTHRSVGDFDNDQVTWL